jgi:hypothetical protein
MIFIFCVLVINIFIVLFMPKRLTKQEIYITWGILAAIAFYTDVFLGAIIDLYDFGKNGVQFYDELINAVIPPSFGVIFLNYMPTSRKQLLIYITSWLAFSVFFEWLCTYVGFMKYKGWSLCYSAIIYFLVFIYLLWHIRFIRKNKKYLKP